MTMDAPHNSTAPRLRAFVAAHAQATRWTAAALVGAAAIAACCWWMQPPEPTWVYVLGGQELGEAAMQSVCHALDAEGLADYHVDGRRLRVPRPKVGAYAAALKKQQALLGGSYAAFDKAADQEKWWSSSAQDDRRWELARQKSLAQQIEQFPEIETASVLIDRASPRGLRASADVRATVTIKTRPAREMPAYRVRQIRSIVAGSVADLAPERVTVVDLTGKTLLELGNAGEPSDELLNRIKEFEVHFAEKIRGVLGHIPEAHVTVSVELDTTRERRTEQVLYRPAEKAKPAATTASGRLEHPSVVANAAVDLPTEQRAAATEIGPTHQETWEEHVALAPKSVTVAVAVPQDVVASLFGGDHGKLPTDWKERIASLVASAVPAGITSKITVAAFAREPARQALGPTTPHRAADSWPSWGAMAGLGAAATVILATGMLRRRQFAASASAAVPSDEAMRDSDAEWAELTRQRASRQRELVRVEAPRSAVRHRPHLVQADIHGFEDIRRLASSGLQAVLAAVDGRLWAPALRGASRELRDVVLSHMTPHAAGLLRSEIASPGPVRLGDVEAAQQEILEVVRRLDHTGDLVLEDRPETNHE
jgi:flagellar biosynthesis/type III secretory pathway M-ring protein FliF/YscJ